MTSIMKIGFRPHQGIIEFNLVTSLSCNGWHLHYVSVPIRGLLNLTENKVKNDSEKALLKFPSPSGDY